MARLNVMYRKQPSMRLVLMVMVRPSDLNKNIIFFAAYLIWSDLYYLLLQVNHPSMN